MGYNVTFVHNITDVNDKIYDAARVDRAPSSPAQASEWYVEDTEALGLGLPDELPKVSQYVPVIVEFIEELIEKGHAYEVDGDVYSASRASATTGLSGRWEPPDDGGGRAGEDGRTARSRRAPSSRPSLPTRRRGGRGARAARDGDRASGGGRPAVRGGRARRAQGRPARLRALEGEQGGRGHVLELAVGPRPPWLAHRVLGDGREHPRRDVRDPWRRHRPALPAPRERARAVASARPRLRVDLGAQRARPLHRRQDVEVRGQRDHDPGGGR